MPLATLIAGQYTGSWNAVALGVMTKRGFELQQETKAEVIEDTDAWAAAAVDFLNHGQNTFVQFECKEYKPGSTGPLAAFGGGVLGVLASAAAPIATLASDLAKPLVLAALAGTPAAASPATLTGAKAVLAPNFNWSLLLSPQLRTVPVRMQLLPTNSSGTYSTFTLT